MMVPTTSHQEGNLGTYNKVNQPSLGVPSKDIIKNMSVLLLLLLLWGLFCPFSAALDLIALLHWNLHCHLNNASKWVEALR